MRSGATLVFEAEVQIEQWWQKSDLIQVKGEDSGMEK
jgi:hypothetical protein